eukprot:22463-Alexandrium_andersonii.AAC.1
MSASLVGSEMCIRDRPARPSAASCGTSTGTGLWPRVARRGAELRVGLACLLYTSDAADDM